MLKSIPLSEIYIGERARPVDRDYAMAIAANMVDRGLINPITVRPTPAANGGKTPYTLVAGGHRLEAAHINAWPEIDAIVVSTDAAEAQLIEISENLYRNELAPADRGSFVSRMVELQEEKLGKVQRGGDRKSKSNDWTSVFFPGKEISERVQERLGIGRSTFFNALKIGRKLTPHLRAALRGTDAEYDHQFVLKLANLPERDQAAVVGALKMEPDPYKAFGLFKPAKPKPDEDEKTFRALDNAWTKATEASRARFLQQIGGGKGLEKAA